MEKRTDQIFYGFSRSLKGFLAVIAFILLLPQLASAQFTYIGASTGFKNNLIGSSEGIGSAEERMFNYGLFLNVKAIHRPLRLLGIGAEVAFPLVQGTANSSYNFVSPGGDTPQGFDYKAKQAFGFTAIASLFADTEANFHADFRFSYISFREEFEFEGLGEMVSFKEKVSFPAAGVALGFMPHLTDHLFFDINFGFDFLLIGSDPDFSYDVDYELEPNGWNYRFVTLESQLSGVKPAFFMNIGLGYFF